MDNVADHYPAHCQVKSDEEVILRYDRSTVMDRNLVGGDIKMLRYVCQYVEPGYVMAMLNYPRQRKTRVELLKIPRASKGRRQPTAPSCRSSLMWLSA